MDPKEVPAELEKVKGEVDKLKKAVEKLSADTPDQQANKEIEKHQAELKVDKEKEIGLRTANWIYPAPIWVTAVYCVVALIITLYFVISQTVNVKVPFDIDANFGLLMKISLFWGALGGAGYAAWALVYHLEVPDFKERYLLWYYLRPFIGAALGLVAVLLILGGLLILTTGSKNNDGTTASSINVYLLLAISALAGIAQKPLINKISEISGTVFTKQEDKTTTTTQSTNTEKTTDSENKK
jgi:hypothetical protein